MSDEIKWLHISNNILYIQTLVQYKNEVYLNENLSKCNLENYFIGSQIY